ncbi:MAG: alpha/beta hydrolase [Subdoligranulum sp.]|nr:alpha/beta hydrolase [Subdoligranulum sp.]
MEVQEFGKQNSRKIMLLPGNMMSWRQFEAVIPLLEKQYHVIAVSTDGYDDTGKTTFTTAEAMAEKLEQYIKEEQDGAIDLVLGESMGGATAGMLFHRQKVKAIPHNSKCRYGERGAADAKPKAQIILDAAKVSAASGGCSKPKQGQRSQSARGFCPRSTMRVPQPDIIEHFGNADAVPQLPERCLSRKAGIVRCCPRLFNAKSGCVYRNRPNF